MNGYLPDYTYPQQKMVWTGDYYFCSRIFDYSGSTEFAAHEKKDFSFPDDFRAVADSLSWNGVCLHCFYKNFGWNLAL